MHFPHVRRFGPFRSLLTRRRRWLGVGLGGAVLAGASSLLFPVVSGRTSSPETARSVALRAFAEAERRDAAHWAAASFQASQGLLDSSLAEYRRQTARPLPLRDFETSRRLFARAETAAWNTALEATAKRQSVDTAARAQCTRAAAMLEMGREFSVLMPLSPQERNDLGRAQVWLREAEALLQAGSIEAAAALAARAESLGVRVGAGCTERAGRYADLRLLERWRRLRHETIAWSRRSGQAAIIVSKDSHTLTLLHAGVVKQRYDVDLGTNSVAAKRMAGDGATPEGKYRIVAKKDVGHSIYYKALLLDYPSKEDLAAHKELRRSGVSTAGPGGQIEIHGEGGRQKDWTRGCVALRNEEMDALFPAVRIGTPVLIIGSHGEGGPIVDLVLRFRDQAGERAP